MSELIRHDPRDKELPFEPDGLVNRALTLAARALHRRGLLWRMNFTLTGRLGGHPLRVPLRHGTGWQHLRMSEVWLFRAMERVLRGRPGAVVDVGVNVGHTLIKMKMADSQRSYVGFEPNPQCLAYVSELIQLNQFTRCVVVPVGASNRTGLLTLHFNHDVDPSATLVEGFREPARYHRSMIVPLSIGDDVLDSIGVDDVAVVKIDVEGGELEVIDGLTRTLRRSMPYVFCEVLPVFDPRSEVARFRAGRHRALLDLLDSLGYNVFRLYVDDSVEPLTDFGVNSDLTLANYVFVPTCNMEQFKRLFVQRQKSGEAVLNETAALSTP